MNKSCLQSYPNVSSLCTIQNVWKWTCLFGTKVTQDFTALASLHKCHTWLSDLIEDNMSHQDARHAHKICLVEQCQVFEQTKQEYEYQPIKYIFLIEVCDVRIWFKVDQPAALSDIFPFLQSIKRIFKDKIMSLWNIVPNNKGSSVTQRVCIAKLEVIWIMSIAHEAGNPSWATVLKTFMIWWLRYYWLPILKAQMFTCKYLISCSLLDLS